MDGLIGTLLTGVGLVVTVLGLFTLANFVYRLFLRAPKNLTAYGAWAVVTGGTDGIGKSYAQELARKGLNVLIISRNPEKLNETKAEIESYVQKKGGKNVEIRTLAVDFSKADKNTYYQTILDELKKIDVGILVNNVGISYDHCEFFHDVADNIIDNLIKINIEATTYMTKIVLPLMIAKKKGAIINLSSMSGVIPAPLLSAYGASKAYVDNFSRMLSLEYQNKGIFVQSVTPAFVVSKMSGFRRATVTIPTADVFVKSAIRTIGYETTVAGYWAHDIVRFVASVLPEWVVGPQVMQSHVVMRKKFLERQQKAK